MKKHYLININTFNDNRGKLSVIENIFDIKRIFYIYELNSETRAKHAHKICKQFIICISGNFDVFVDDGKTAIVYNLYKPNMGLYIDNLVWTEIYPNDKSACLVLASEKYEKDDYITDYSKFIKLIRQKKCLTMK